MNIANFEEELKVAQKGSEDQVCLWLQLISITVLRHHDAKYFQEFQMNQQEVYQIIFGRERTPGLLLNIYNRIIQTSKSNNLKHQYLDNLALMYQFVTQLTPHTQTNFYELLMSDQNYLSQIPYHVLPHHLQLFVCDQTVASNNPHFGNWQDTFAQNLFQQVSTPKQSMILSRPSSSILMNSSPQKTTVNKSIQSYSLDVRLSAPLTFWVYLLNSLQNYKEQFSTDQPLNNDLFQVFQDKMGSQLPVSEKIFLAMIQNPVLLIIRRILSSLCTKIESVTSYQHSEGKISPTKTLSHQQLLQLLSKMIVLVQEYTLYSCLLKLNPNELKLTTFQAQNFLRLRAKPYIMDIHLQVMYMLVALNAQYGSKMESYYQQYAQIYLNPQSVRLNQSSVPQQQNINKSFFFTAGRQLQQFTFQQALFRVLSYGIQNYTQDRMCFQISLQSYVSLWVLYARWPYARHEIQILNLTEIFDQVMQQYLDQLLNSQRQLELSVTRQRVSLFGQLVNLYNSLLWKAVQRFNYVNYTFKLALIKGTRPNQVKYQQQESKNLTNQFSYHFLELKPKLQEFHYFLKINFPLFTVLFNKLIKNLSLSNSMTTDEVQALAHMVSFMSTTDPSMKDQDQRDTYIKSHLYVGGIKFIDQNGFYVQQPQMQELRGFCEYLESSQDIKTTAMSHLYQIFHNQNLKVDVQRVVNSLVSHSNSNQSTLDHLSNYTTIRCLELIYGLPVSNQDILRKKSTIKEASIPYQSRLSLPQIQIVNQWQIPPKDTEIVFLLHLLRYFSFFLDRVTCRSSIKYKDNYKEEQLVFPATQWPRSFANFDNLKILPIFTLFFYIMWYLFDFKTTNRRPNRRP